MAKNREYIEFEGLFAERVLGIFTIIRGFANLRDLAAVSVPYEMVPGDQTHIVNGHQRVLNPNHAEDIKKYLERSDNRFIPEVILAVRYDVAPIRIENEIVGVKTPEDSPIVMDRRFTGKNHRIQKILVRRNELEAIKAGKLIRRIDGNHRLALAEELQEDMNLPQKYQAPFCMILLGPPDNDADDFAESLIFHTINSTALHLESEHSLRLLLGQNPTHSMTPDMEFDYNPGLHLTRLLADRLRVMPAPARQRFGENPMTALWDSARNLLAMDAAIAQDRQKLTAFADDLFAGLTDIATQLTVNQPSLCRTHSFIELAARVWRDAEGENHEQRIRYTVNYLDQIGNWLGRQGITNLLNPLSPAQQLLETFKASQLHIPKRVFLARWYPALDALGGAHTKSELRLQQLRQTLENIRLQHSITLELIDLGSEEGGTFPIHNKMYDAIASSDIIICDLTGHRPNVYVEAGYALKHHEKNRLIFLFEPQSNDDKVPFDLNTFKYVPISQAAEIPGKLKPEIEAILKSAGATLSD